MSNVGMSPSVVAKKAGRGRPPKVAQDSAGEEMEEEEGEEEEVPNGKAKSKEVLADEEDSEVRGDGEEGDIAPAKKGRGRPPGKAKKSKKGEDSGEEEEEAKPKGKGRGRPPGKKAKKEEDEVEDEEECGGWSGRWWLVLPVK